MKQCNCIIGLATINDEDDEFVTVVMGDDIDFNAGGNTAFNYCPMCGKFINPIIRKSLKL